MMRSVRWLSVAQASKVMGQLVSLVVLSRLLPPSAYGVMAMAGVVMVFATLLRDMGTAAAIIQRKTLTDALADTVFLLNLCVGLSLGLILAASSQPLSVFFREPELRNVLLLLSVTFPLSSLTTVHQATMERASRFRELAILEVIVQVSGVLLSVLAAWLGAGVYSFVIPTVVNAVVTSLWLWFKSGYRPRGAWTRSEFHSLWAFSGSLTAFNFINYFARNADSMIVGRMLGSTSLGQYGMAYKLMLFPVQHMSWVIGRALLPRLSGIQNDLPAVRAVYVRVLGGIALLSTPMMVGLWALREPFTAAVLGPKWAIVAPLLAWLAPVGWMQSLMSTIGSTLTSQGRTGALLKLGIFNTATVLIGFAVGALFGVVEVAMGYFVANLVNFIVTAVCMGRWLQAPAGPLWRELKAPVISALLMGATLWGATWSLRHVGGFQAHQLPPAVALAVLIVLGGSVYLGALALLFKQSPRQLIKTLKGGS